MQHCVQQVGSDANASIKTRTFKVKPKDLDRRSPKLQAVEPLRSPLVFEPRFLRLKLRIEYLNVLKHRLPKTSYLEQHPLFKVSATPHWRWLSSVTFFASRASSSKTFFKFSNTVRHLPSSQCAVVKETTCSPGGICESSPDAAQMLRSTAFLTCHSVLPGLARSADKVIALSAARLSLKACLLRPVTFSSATTSGIHLLWCQQYVVMGRPKLFCFV